MIARLRIPRRLRDAPIRGKLVAIITLTCGAGIVVAGLATFALQLYTLRATFTRDISALAEIVANNLSGPVAFGDRKAALEVLASLKAKPQIAAAMVVTAQGEVLAQTGFPLPPPTTPVADVRFSGWSLRVVAPVAVGHDVVGLLQLNADFRATFFAMLQFFLVVITATGLGAVGIALAVGHRLQSLIVEPLHRLSTAASRIGARQDYSVRVEKLGDDELGLLTDAFNNMLAQLQHADTDLRRANQALTTEIQERQRLQGELVTASRLAGMADIATGVLHNVGNVLNSVNVSAGLMREQLRSSRVGLVAQTARLVREQEGDLSAFFAQDPRGRRLPEFLGRLSEQLASEQTRLRTELEQLSGNIDHIKEIVAMQQSYAKTSAVIEQIDPAQLFEQALAIHRLGIERHGVMVSREFPAELATIASDRHKILQILTNFVANAIQATKVNLPGQRLIHVSIAGTERATIAFSVRDNGVGIAPENMPRLFQQGFTTRSDGHGFGLHSGALMARALRGRIDVFSDGPGRGARFTLHLPLSSSAS